MKLSYKKIFLIVLIALVVCVPLLSALPVHAQDAPTSTPPPLPFDAAQKAAQDFGIFGNAVLWILEVIAGFIGYLVVFMANLTSWMLDFSTTVMTFPVVQAGFEITLSLVNLLFVMSLIVISFEIILDHNVHHAKELLAKVIISALLINFSLLIAGFLLDISNVFTYYFIQPINRDTLLGAFGHMKLGGALFGSGLFGAAISGLFSIITTALVLITLTAVFIMTTVRTIVVAGLLLLMPLAWGLRVMPHMEEKSDEWWKAFIKYGVMYLPTLTFFLWLAIVTAGNTEFRDSTAALQTGSIAFGETMAVLVRMILIIGIIVFGLKTAEEAGGIGSGIGMKMASGLKSAGKGLAKAAYTTDVKGWGLQAGVKKTGRGLSNALSNKYVNWFPGTTRAANALAGANKRAEDVKTTQKNKYSQVTNDQLEGFLKSPPFAELERAALLQEAASRHMLDKVPSEKAGAFIQAARAMNPGTDIYDIDSVKKLLSHDPSLAAQSVERGKGMSDEEFLEKQTASIIKAIRKAKPEDAGKWGMHVIKHLKPEHFAAVTNDQVTEIGATGDPEQIKALDKHLEKLEEAIGNGSIKGEKALENAAAGLKRLKKFRDDNPGWQAQRTRVPKKEEVHTEPHPDAGGGHGGGGGGGGAKPSGGGGASHGGGGASHH